MSNDNSLEQNKKLLKVEFKEIEKLFELKPFILKDEVIWHYESYGNGYLEIEGWGTESFGTNVYNAIPRTPIDNEFWFRVCKTLTWKLTPNHFPGTFETHNLKIALRINEYTEKEHGMEELIPIATEMARINKGLNKERMIYKKQLQGLLQYAMKKMGMSKKSTKWAIESFYSPCERNIVYPLEWKGAITNEKK